MLDRLSGSDDGRTTNVGIFDIADQIVAFFDNPFDPLTAFAFGLFRYFLEDAFEAGSLLPGDLQVFIQRTSVGCPRESDEEGVA